MDELEGLDLNRSDSQQSQHRFYRINSQTRVVIEGEGSKNEGGDRRHSKEVSLDDIGGLVAQVAALTELVDLHFTKKHQLSSHGKCSLRFDVKGTASIKMHGINKMQVFSPLSTHCVKPYFHRI